MPTTSTKEMRTERPLSPHLTIYKKQISSVMSIFHRITGVGIFLGFSILTWWFSVWIFTKFDHEVFNMINYFFVRIGLYGFIGAFCYHLCNGIRHLFWDIGKGYSLPTMRKSGWIAFTVALALAISFSMIIS